METPTTKLHQQVDNTTRYYYLHTAKTGGTTVARAYFPRVRDLFEFRDLGTAHDRLIQQPNFTWWMDQQSPKVRVFITEGGGYAQQPPPHALVIFREPVSHVLSMYYHCTASRFSNPFQRRTMKDRQHWLQTWDRIRMKHPQEFDPFSSDSNRSLAISLWRNSSHYHQFGCYIPVNFQSRLVGHYNVQTKQQLSDKFHVVGITDDLEGSACLFFVQVHQEVPPLCDCSDFDASVGNNQTTTTETLKIIQRVQHIDHGVGQNVNASQKTLSDLELALIRNMTRLDQRLYDLGKELFQEQVAHVEQRYNVKLCRRSILS